MGITISISSYDNGPTGFPEYFGLPAEIEIEVYTLREILHTLIGGHPQKIRILDENGELRRFVGVFLNEEIDPPNIMNRLLVDGDNVVIYPRLCRLFYQLIEKDFLKLA